MSIVNKTHKSATQPGLIVAMQVGS